MGRRYVRKLQRSPWQDALNYALTRVIVPRRPGEKVSAPKYVDPEHQAPAAGLAVPEAFDRGEPR